MGESANGTRRVAGGFLGFIGYMLSPLSWWNDLFVNVPDFGPEVGIVLFVLGNDACL